MIPCREFMRFKKRLSMERVFRKTPRPLIFDSITASGIIKFFLKELVDKVS